MNLQENIKKEFDAAKDKVQFLNDLRKYISSLSPEKVNPVDCVLWVDKDMVVANNYNPNHVADKEMRLLYTSVREDGYTMPIVTIWDEKLQKYVIIDGFHRNLVIRKFADINERCGGKAAYRSSRQGHRPAYGINRKTQSCPWKSLCRWNGKHRFQYAQRWCV